MMGVKEDVCHCDVSGQLVEIRGLLNVLAAQVEALRQQKLPADPGNIEEMMAAIYAIFQDDEFTSFLVFDECTAKSAAAQQLRAAISACLKGRLTIRKLSFFLSKTSGTHGSYTLEYCGKQREGHYFRVTK